MQSNPHGREQFGMFRCIIVQGLPLLPSTARSTVAGQLVSIVRASLGSRTGVSNDKDSIGKLFRVEVKVDNFHNRLEEAARITFSPDLDDAILEETYGALDQSAAENPIRLPPSFTRFNNVPINYEPFVPKFSVGAGKIRDYNFPSMPHSLRRRVQCDGVATYSLTHELAARRTARLLKCFLDDPTNCSAVDGMAGVGGNTMGFLQYWKRVVAVEADNERASMLQSNVDLWKEWRDGIDKDVADVQVKNQCVIDYLAHTNTMEDLLFLDPPWGGPQYADQIEQQNGDIILVPEDSSHNHSQSPRHVVNCGEEWRFSEGVLAIAHSNTFRIVAMKLPSVFNLSLIVDPLVHADGLGPERWHPFRFHFKSKTKLLVLIRNDGNASYTNGPQGLDRMICNIMEWREYCLDLSISHHSLSKGIGCLTS